MLGSVPGKAPPFFERLCPAMAGQVLEQICSGLKHSFRASLRVWAIFHL